MLLPAIGITAEIISTFARKKLFGYKTILYTAFATGVLSFFVWAHHQFVAGIDPRMANVFTITTLLISVPIAEMCFVYIATLYGGVDPLTTPMLWALAFIGRVPDRRRDGHLPRREWRGHLLPRHVLRARALPLHVLPDRDHRDVLRLHLLVPEDVRQDDERPLGQDSLLGHDHPVQLHLHPALRARDGPASTAASTTSSTSRSWRPWACSTSCVIATMALAGHARLPARLLLELHQELDEGEKAAGKNPWKANTLEWTTESPPPHGNWPRGAAERATGAVRVRCTRTVKKTTGPRRRPRPAEADQGLGSSGTPSDPREPRRGLDSQHETDCNDPKRHRDPDRPLAVWWVLASEIVIFGGLLGPTSCTASAPSGPPRPRPHTNTTDRRDQHLRAAHVVLFAVLAHQAAELGNGKGAAKFSCFTIGAGALMFLCIKSYEWNVRDLARLHDHGATPSGPSTTRRRGCTRST